jgi:hypothetical protein
MRLKLMRVGLILRQYRIPADGESNGAVREDGERKDCDFKGTALTDRNIAYSASR